MWCRMFINVISLTSYLIFLNLCENWLKILFIVMTNDVILNLTIALLYSSDAHVCLHLFISVPVRLYSYIYGMELVYCDLWVEMSARNLDAPNSCNARI